MMQRFGITINYNFDWEKDNIRSFTTYYYSKDRWSEEEELSLVREELLYYLEDNVVFYEKVVTNG